MTKKISFSKEEIIRLYESEKMSSRQVANKYGCSKSTILELIKKYGLRARSKKETSRMIIHPIKHNISKEQLEELYINKTLSMQQIAEIFGTVNSVIFNKIKGYGIKSRTFNEGNILSIPRRSRSIAKSKIKYKKEDFIGNILEKSYLIGFRLGDLHIRKNKYGETIFISCKSTKPEQINLIKNLFNKYGNIIISKPYKDKGRQITCSVNLSFSFLLDKEDVIQDWIVINNKNFITFLAGYIDAEGHFGLDRNFGEFAVSSYDKNIICCIYKKLLELNIEGNFPFISKKRGYIDKRGIRHKKDLWTFRIRRKDQLLRFVNLLKPHIKHKKRYRDLIIVQKNIIERNKKMFLKSV